MIFKLLKNKIQNKDTKSKFKFLNVSAILLLVAIIFTSVVNADAILVTSRASGTLGHTSVISQDKSGHWHYFYWGNKIAYRQKVPDEYIKNINTFNVWMKQQKNKNKKPKQATNYYTHGFYIKGDFTKSTEYYSKAIDNYKPWKYYIGLNFCSVVSRKALNKGILADGKSFEKHLKYIWKDYIPFYDDFPDHYRQLIERSFKNTKYEGSSDWGKVINKKILQIMNQRDSSSGSLS